MVTTQAIHYTDRQLTPTLWERVAVYDDGSEVVVISGTLAEILESWLPLLIPKRWLIGCDCEREDCPTPEQTPTGDRREFIEAFTRIHETWAAVAYGLHLDAGGRSACGGEQPSDTPGHAKKNLVRPDYWQEWEGRQCSRCAVLVKALRVRQGGLMFGGRSNRDQLVSSMVDELGRRLLDSCCCWRGVRSDAGGDNGFSQLFVEFNCT